MTRSILVPLDGTDFGEGGLALATHVAEASGARIFLAHVHVPNEPADLLSNTSFQWEGVDLSEYDGKQRGQEQEYLDGLVASLAEDDRAAEARLLESGAVIDELVGYAHEVRTDLIVMRSHARGAVRRTFLGGVADGLIRESGVPVLVVPARDEDATPAEPGIDHVLVALDESRLAEEVLEPAGRLAADVGARLTLLRVITRHAPPDADRTPEAYLASVAAPLRERGLAVETDVVLGQDAARSILSTAAEREADLIALATHGFGGLKRAVFGSVADRVLQRAQVPLLVVRPER